MTEPIVLELQRLAADKSHDIGDLLRKALIVATKLRIEDFKTWINNELNGYDRREDLPEYRRIPTQLRTVNRWRGGLDPVLFDDPELERLLCSVPLPKPISEVDSLARGDQMRFQMSVTAAEMSVFWTYFTGGAEVEVVRVGARTSLISVVEAVRNTVLEWALRLEEQGIVGQGMSFSAEEKTKAMNNPNIHIGSIGNFQGILGGATESTVNQSLEMSVGSGDFLSLERLLRAQGVDAEDCRCLKEAIEQDPKPTEPGRFGQRVSHWIGKMTGKAASGAWKVTLDTAGKLLPGAIAAYYGLKC